MHQITNSNEDSIRSLAHAYWEAEGCPDGRDKIHWQRALLELADYKHAGHEGHEVMEAGAATDISLIDGIGPKITLMLHDAGIESLSQIASMTDDEMAALDDELELRGRSSREEWVKQANELLAGHAPRAEIDKAHALQTND